MSDCGKHRHLIVGRSYTVNAKTCQCILCSEFYPPSILAVYDGHDLFEGETCGLYTLVAPHKCTGCNETMQRLIEPCGGGFTSDLFTRQSEPAEVATDTPTPRTEATT